MHFCQGTSGAGDIDVQKCHVPIDQFSVTYASYAYIEVLVIKSLANEVLQAFIIRKQILPRISQ